MESSAQCDGIRINIMRKNIKNSLIYWGLFCLLVVLAGKALAAIPLWTLSLSPGNNSTQIIPENRTGAVQYVVKNQSSKPKKLVIQPLPGIARIAPCYLAPKGQVGDSCVLNIALIGSTLPQTGVHGGPSLCQANSDNSPNTNACYQPSSTNLLHITRGSAASAAITVTPSHLRFLAGTNGSVTVTNSLASQEPAYNVAAMIPDGSPISVQSTTCGASLAIGVSCIITFTSNIQEGATAISIGGDNTNAVNVDVTATALPLISIVSPVLQNRVVTVYGMVPLSLTIINNIGDTENANAITVSDQTNCPSLSVNDSNCASVAPGETCILELTSDKPYVPCTITINGSNTANSLQTRIAFFHLGGLVITESGGSGLVVTDGAQQFSSAWLSSNTDIPGSSSSTDGVSNTNAITADAACLISPSNCAAQRCRDIGAEWYLPSTSELFKIKNSLCANSKIPCDFGGFSSSYYWSSRGASSMQAWCMQVYSGVGIPCGQPSSAPVRCFRAFIP